jgi:BarA-like signal transduction histidine kinase
MWSHYDWVVVNVVVVSKHNMWSYYEWVVVVVIITQPHVVFTDGQQQRQLNHNTTTYCVY